MLPKLSFELTKLVNYMNSTYYLSIKISGLTGNVVKQASNLDLLRVRAKTTIANMVGNCIAKLKLSFRGCDCEQVVADNNTAVGRAQNRRIKVMVITK